MIILLVCITLISGCIFTSKVWPERVGFSKLLPTDRTILMSNGTFTGLFTNGVGAKIKVGEIRIFTKTSQIICSNFFDMEVPAGDNFRFNIEDCGERETGQQYVLLVEIDYNTPISGITMSHRESGKLYGYVDNIRYLLRAGEKTQGTYSTSTTINKDIFKRFEQECVDNEGSHKNTSACINKTHYKKIIWTYDSHTNTCVSGETIENCDDTMKPLGVVWRNSTCIDGEMGHVRCFCPAYFCYGLRISNSS